MTIIRSIYGLHAAEYFSDIIITEELPCHISYILRDSVASVCAQQQQHFMTFMSLSEFHSSGIFSTQANFVQYCIQSAILQQCPASRSDMYLTNSEEFADGFYWTCPSCPNNRHSIRKDSIFHDRKISLHSFLQILWHSLYFPDSRARISLSEYRQEYLCLVDSGKL